MLVYQAARQKAAELLEAHWDGTFPVKLGPITEALGAKKLSSSMSPEISGLVVKTPGGAPSIVINDDEPKTRQRFTWAHELGHIVERAEIGRDDDYSYIDARGGKYDLHEFFADEFAGALLMPGRALRERLDAELSHAVIAQEFGVSVPALVKRLQRLAKNPERN